MLPTCSVPNERLAGARFGLGLAPVPVRLTVCGLPEASYVMVMVPVRTPGAVGAKVTLIVQLAAAGTELPHVLVWE